MTRSHEESLEVLIEGNNRFVQGTQTFPDADINRLNMTAREGQNPFAAIVACADSRTPPEYFFDQGIGNLFVVRTAGNVICREVIGSIELGVDKCGSNLIAVVGHSDCGVMNMAVNDVECTENQSALIDRVRPALENVRREYPNVPRDNLPDLLARQHALYSVDILLSESKMLSELTLAGKLKLAAAYFDLATGLVEWLN